MIDELIIEFLLKDHLFSDPIQQQHGYGLSWLCYQLSMLIVVLIFLFFFFQKHMISIIKSQLIYNICSNWLLLWYCCLRFNQNYGVLGVLDRLHRTDAMFRKTKAYDRHIMLLSLVPIKEMFPDDTKTVQKSCSSKSE